MHAVLVDEGLAVHPHSRGEQVEHLIIQCGFNGSSPLAWGTGPSTPMPSFRHRFIPTRVGNSVACPAEGAANPVHPHSRGEQVAGVAHVGRPQRFIPTRVGNRWLESRMSADPNGSSPLAWGTGLGTLDSKPLHRFIPTRVGNSDMSR